ncbi:TRAP transporter small permease [Bacillus sp. Marseille-P3661]|uniref:TRAP transporter small permease n=1 Tax=Bacillus sp. Marseille-P3661 TaxID=1936234 RepID=UPI000C8622CB|nr:TRAP transporter small permease [Bacillus sp. Marseille-P3661]
MKFIKMLDRHLEEALLVIFSTVMTSVIFIQVVMRMSGNSLSWSEELGRYCFIWLVYIGIAYGVKKQRHIKVDVMLLLFKDRGKLVLTIISNILFLIFAVLVVYHGNAIAQQLLGFGQKSPALHVPMGFVYLASPVGMGLSAIRLIQVLIPQFKALFGNGEYVIETRENENQ